MGYYKRDRHGDYVMKRYWINAAQMSAAVYLGLLLSPIVLATRHMLYDMMSR
jgi:hypothetical protein